MSASTDLAVMLNLCIEEREKLRELNEELLEALKMARTICAPESDKYSSNALDQIDKAIAKAEARE